MNQFFLTNDDWFAEIRMKTDKYVDRPLDVYFLKFATISQF